MSKSSRVRFQLFVAWNVHRVVFLPIFVFWLFLFSWFFCCMDYFGDYNKSSSALFMLYSGRCIDTSTLSWMLVSPLPPFFLGIYNMSTSSLGCKALFILMSFLFSSPFVGVLLSYTLRMVPSISRWGQPRNLSLICHVIWFRVFFFFLFS